MEKRLATRFYIRMGCSLPSSTVALQVSSMFMIVLPQIKSFLPQPLNGPTQYFTLPHLSNWTPLGSSHPIGVQPPHWVSSLGRAGVQWSPVDNLCVSVLQSHCDRCDQCV